MGHLLQGGRDLRFSVSRFDRLVSLKDRLGLVMLEVFTSSATLPVDMATSVETQSSTARHDREKSELVVRETTEPLGGVAAGTASLVDRKSVV